MDIQCHACIGGTNVRADLAKLEMGQHIVVGTPGRVHDMINRKALGELTHPYLELFGNSSDFNYGAFPNVRGVGKHEYQITAVMVYRSTDPRHIKMFVLDEADEMLSRGFKDQIYDVFRKLPSNIQVEISGWWLVVGYNIQVEISGLHLVVCCNIASGNC